MMFGVQETYHHVTEVVAHGIGEQRLWRASPVNCRFRSISPVAR